MRYALRTLARSPAFTFTALAALALGIGVNVAIFSVVNTVLLRPLNAPAVDRIVRFRELYGTVASDTVGPPAYVMVRALTGAFYQAAAHRLETLNLTGGAESEQIPVARVTAGFFLIFGVPLIQGRAFAAGEDRPGAPLVAVISYELWMRRFAGDPSVVGKSITLGNAARNVVGVLAPRFDSEQFDSVPDAWIPFQIDSHAPQEGDLCVVTARLREGVSLAQARQRLAAADAERRRLNPKSTAKADVEPLRNAMVGDVRPSLLLLTGAVGLVLLIACANVAGLLLVRATGRRREFAIRASIGAGRFRIARQLLTESLVLSLTGGLLGLLFGLTAIRAILTLYSGRASGNLLHIPRISSVTLVAFDWRVAAFALLLSILTAVLFGLVPAIEVARANLISGLKEDSGPSGSTLRQTAKRGIFVTAEVSLALVLLIGSALLIRTYIALRLVNPGFDTRHVLVTQMALAGTPLEKGAGLEQLIREGTGRLRTLPGVANAAAACCIPLETTWQMPLIVQGRPLQGWFHAFAGYTFVSPEYFDALRIPVLRGRAFSDRDRNGATPVAIINQALARQLWPNRNPLQDQILLGKGMGAKYDHETPRQIVGIVGDIHDRGLNRAARPAMYIPIAQLPDEVGVASIQLLPIAWFIRVPRESQVLDRAIRQELEQASAGLPITPIRSMGQVSSQSTGREQFEMLLMTIFGGAALLLAAIGIYGVMAYTVQQRTRELGIRLALGATQPALRRMVVLQGLRLAAAGVAIGIAASFWVTRLLANLLFGVKPRDPLVFAIAPLILIAAALAAAWLPALRISRIDPQRALRCD